MGRNAKRVPLDFDWPLGKTYVGYINPYSGVKCPWCEGGYSPEAQKIRAEVRGDWCTRKLNPYTRGTFYNPKRKQHHMTQDEVNYFMEKALSKNDKPIIDAFMQKHYPDIEKVTPEIFSHMCLAYNEMPLFFPYSLDLELIKYHSEKEGWSDSCPHCNGSGRVWYSEDVRKLYEEWQPKDPPTGEGYQIWEDTGEGSPITPVFATAEELAEYCECKPISWFGSQYASKEKWLKLINSNCPATVEVAPGVIMI